MKICGLDLSMNGSGVCVLDLDDDLNIKDVDWLGFTTVKKNQRENHSIYYKHENFSSRMALSDMMIEKIVDKVNGCALASVESFAVSRSAGMLCDIGMFIGSVTRAVWKAGTGLRWYGITVSKKHFTGRGTADKIGMWEEFQQCKLPKPDLSGYPIPPDKDGVSPTSDIVDAYALALLLRKELLIRTGRVSLDKLSKVDKEVFGKKKKVTILNEKFDMDENYNAKFVECNRFNIGGTRSEKDIKYIVMHYTANRKDTALSNANYFKNNAVKSSAHYFVDSNGIVQSVPDNMIAWHCGGGKQSDEGGSLFGVCKNGNSIGIEFCNDEGRADFVPSDKALMNGAILVKSLMRKYKVPLENVVRHFDVTGKKCPLWGIKDEDWVRIFKWRL